jgi:hypothetical protein
LAPGGVRIERRSKRVGSHAGRVGNGASKPAFFCHGKIIAGNRRYVLNVPAYDVLRLGEGVDEVVVGATDGTPWRGKLPRDAPDAMRRSIKANDMTRSDFEMYASTGVKKETACGTSLKRRACQMPGVERIE